MAGYHFLHVRHREEKVENSSGDVVVVRVFVDLDSRRLGRFLGTRTIEYRAPIAPRPALHRVRSGHWIAVADVLVGRATRAVFRDRTSTIHRSELAILGRLADLR